MQITKITKKQQQKQQQQPQSQQQQVQSHYTKTLEPKMGAKFLRLSKVKLIVVMATSLVAALFACCSQFKGESYNEEHELETEYKSAQQEQMLVRKYVNERLKMYQSGSKFSGANERRTGHMFAKMILNAYDRPYQHVIDAINERLREIKATNGNKEELKLMKPAVRMLTEAYGKALEDSQKYSVLVQEEIRRSQEEVKNQEGEMSKVDESFAQWHLEELADFETRLVGTYLMYALEQ